MLNSKFNAVEVLEMAKDIEKNGLDFYKKHAQETDDEELEKLFLKLASDEQDHYNTFDNLSKKLKKETGDEVEYIYDQQVSAYLDALVEFTVFPPQADLEEFIGTNSVGKVLLIAIMAEKESILFYQEMLRNNRGEAADILEKLIKEEKDHLLELTKYDAQLS